MQPHDSRSLALRDRLGGLVISGTGGRRYRLGELVGEGPQSWVFGASSDLPGEPPVVVKVLRPDSVTAESLGRFDRDAQLLRKLGEAASPNPHIARFYDSGHTQVAVAGVATAVELPFTVLEWVRGTTLERVLAQTRGVGLALDRTRRIAGQVVLALEDAHAHAIVHRDLKPSNVLLALPTDVESEVAKVTDFGLAKIVDVSVARLAGATLGYAPPEQFEHGGRRMGPRADVFSIAAILYEMLTGTKAFPHSDGENPLVIVTRLLNAPRPRLAATRGALPPELGMRSVWIERLDAVFERATAAEPKERHASIREFWLALEPLLRVPSERSPSMASDPHGGPAPDARILTPSVQVRQHPLAVTDGAPASRSRVSRLDATARLSPTLSEANASVADPAAWKWRVHSPSRRPGFVRAGAFQADGNAAIAIGPDGLLRWDGPSWSPLRRAVELDVQNVRGMAWPSPGELIVFGAHGLAARLVPGGGAEIWSLPDSSVTLLGAFADPQGTVVTLVGERPAPLAVRGGGQTATMGTIAQFARGKLMLLADAPTCARLRGVTRLRAGEIVACGDWGTLVRLELGVAVHAGLICGGHLHAIAALGDGGAVTVGAGGHALALSSRLEPQLEAVQTTRDLFALAVDSAGVSWAGAAQARLLRRLGSSWVRMSGELGLSSSVVTVWAAPRTVRAICDDGAVIEGTVSSE